MNTSGHSGRLNDPRRRDAKPARVQAVPGPAAPVVAPAGVGAGGHLDRDDHDRRAAVPGDAAPPAGDQLIFSAIDLACRKSSR